MKTNMAAIAFTFFLSSISSIVSGQALNAVPPSPNFSELLLSIKMPQLIGIIAGVIVFVATITTVFVLLYYSGSFTRLKEELKATSAEENSVVSPQFSQIPELYDHLISLAKTLPLKPDPPTFFGRRIVVKVLADEHIDDLIISSNGSALYSQGSYHPDRIWGWFGDFFYSEKPYKQETKHSIALSEYNANRENEKAKEEASSSCRTRELDGAALLADKAEMKFRASYSTSVFESIEDSTSVHLTVIDQIVRKPIGMLSLLSNDPRNLSVKIGKIWLTPNYQGQKLAHEAVLLVLQWLFRSGYRRVTAEADTRHQIYRKFLLRCGFRQESILYKHRIVQNRNRDTALYVILNSDFVEVEIKLKSYLGWELKEKMHKIAEIERPEPIASLHSATTRKGISDDSSVGLDLSLIVSSCSVVIAGHASLINQSEKA